MKRTWLGLVLVAVLLILAGGWYAFSQRSNGATPSVPAKSAGPATVAEISCDPGRLRGEVKVLAVVGAVRPGEGLFGLVDGNEVDSDDCTVECATPLLPVSWTGAMPELGQTVIVTGSIQRSPKGFVLAANQVEAQ